MFFRSTAARRIIKMALIFSIFSNVLYLAVPLFMLQIYDRVIPSENVTTLTLLSIAIVIAIGVQVGLDGLRSIILSRLSILTDAELQEATIQKIIEMRSIPGSHATMEPMNDIEKVQQAISGGAITSFFDAPWFPIYLIMLYLLHPLFVVFALVASALLLAAIIFQFRSTKAYASATRSYHAQHFLLIQAAFARSEVVMAMGMLRAILRNLGRQRQFLYATILRSGQKRAYYSSLAKGVRYSAQVLILSLAAYLVVSHNIGASAIFAAMTLMTRALAPMDQLVAHWSTLVDAGECAKRLDELLSSGQIRVPLSTATAQTGQLDVEGVTLRIGQNGAPVLMDVSFSLPGGSVLAIVGPSGSGKSTLARLVSGVWKPNAGVVRLDGHDIYRWSRNDIGRYVGYLPQDVALFPGSIANNIARFEEADAEEVMEAARRAGVHEMISCLPSGYDTVIGEDGVMLSGGQRQRIGLARAFFRQPRLIILDEPNSNLDGEGEVALRDAIKDARSRGSTVILITHQKSLMSVCDYVALIKDGSLQFFLEREAAVTRLIRPVEPRKIDSPVEAVSQ